MNFTHATVLAAAAALFASSTLSAQQRAVFPIDREIPGATGFPFHVDGNSSTTLYPFSGGVSRVQYVVETRRDGISVLNLPANAQINSLRFPADGTIQSFGESLQMQILMAHTTRNAGDASSTFDDNYTSGLPQTVFATQIFTLPDLNNPLAPGGISQEVVVPLDTPFTFDGVSNLLIEFVITANSNGNQSFTYRLDWGFDNSVVNALGNGCQTSGGSVPTLTSQPTAIGDTWSIALSSAPASSMVSLSIGLSNFPAADLGFIGAPGCVTQVSPVATIADTTSTGGFSSWNFSVGNDIALWQLDVYSEAFCVDLFANPGGLVTSNTDNMRLGINPPATMIERRGDAAAVTGTLRRNWGQIFYLEYN